MRKVHLDSLPKMNSGMVNWKKSVGHTVEFKYEGIIGQVKISEYVNKYLKIEYKNNYINILPGNFIKCKIGVLLGKINKKYKYYVNQIIENTDSRKIKITDLLYVDNVRGYRFTCLECGNVDITLEHHLIMGRWCNVCCSAPKKVLKGFNDIFTTNPSFVELLWNREDGHKYTAGSGQRVDFRCPNCNERINNKRISNIRNFGLSCPRCSDGISYPEKLVYNALRQSGVFDLESQYSPAWAVVTNHDIEKLNGKKYYDMHSKTYNFTLEVQGGQHSKESSRKGKRSRSLDEEQENDRLKEELHLKNDVAIYIKIDADKSELDYIKQNLLHSELANIINIQAVDWKRCDEDSQKSLVKVACDYFNTGIYSTKDISHIMMINQGTVIRYLKQGTGIGWCKYDVIEEKRKSNSRAGIKRRKKIVQLSACGNFIKEYESATAASMALKLSTGNISSVCDGKRNLTGNFKWMYKEDYEKYSGEIVPYKRKVNNKPVVRMALEGIYIDEYDSASEAFRILNIDYRSISRVCLNKQKSAGGFIWMFKEDFEKLST